jgi:hypothetical protein
MDELKSPIQSLLVNLVNRQEALERNVAVLIDHVQQIPRFFSPVHADQLLKLQVMLKPAFPVGARFVRIGGENDGGYVMVNHGLNDTSVYNFGIGQEVTWDQTMANRGNTI